MIEPIIKTRNQIQEEMTATRNLRTQKDPADLVINNQKREEVAAVHLELENERKNI